MVQKHCLEVNNTFSLSFKCFLLGILYSRGFCLNGTVKIQNSIQIKKLEDLILKSRKRGNLSAFQNCYLTDFYTNKSTIPAISILVPLNLNVSPGKKVLAMKSCPFFHYTVRWLGIVSEKTPFANHTASRTTEQLFWANRMIQNWKWITNILQRNI